MAIVATTEWDVRTTGNDNNGGGFDPAASGTDYSTQDSPQVVFTDLVIGVTNTQLTSALNPFTSAHVGNIINITSGTGFTAARYQVSSVSGSTATMDRAVGTAGSTGGHGNLGGAMLTVLNTKIILVASGGVIHVKSGTYTFTTTQGWRTGFIGGYSIIGYQTSHYDNGTKPLFTTATNSTPLVSIGNLTFVIRNCSFSNTAAVRASGMVFIGGTQNPTWTFIDCIFDGFTLALDGSTQDAVAGINCIRCEIKNCTTGAIASTLTSSAVLNGNIRVIDSYIHDNTGYGILNSIGGYVDVSGSLIVNNTLQGISITTTAADVRIVRSTIANNGGDGVASSIALNTLILSSSIFYGNGGWGVNKPSPKLPVMIGQANAFGSNTSGNRNNVSAGIGDVSLSADPFTNSAGRNYALNSTAGGGTACKGAGYPGTFPGAVSVGHLDIGAVQTTGSGGSGSGGGSFAFIG
ncbi:MAG: hypothetical protein JWQ87_1856 [Candidatus Sulfotelmatobacter sp.]|nr:hypothetical protein [Candidatus Sulfotelmatobacter sp.]